MSVLSGLKPESVFKYFEALCSVPHGSGNTKQISDLCVSYAKKLGLRYRQEPCNNVIIWKDGSAGYEDAAPIMLQGHIDMVCAKTDDCTKDMAKDGLDLRTDGEWVWADKTSLGGDNGIAVAMILAILEDETLPHPPIEAVFTGPCPGLLRSEEPEAAEPGFRGGGRVYRLLRRRTAAGLRYARQGTAPEGGDGLSPHLGRPAGGPLRRRDR